MGRAFGLVATVCSLALVAILMALNMQHNGPSSSTAKRAEQEATAAVAGMNFTGAAAAYEGRERGDDLVARAARRPAVVLGGGRVGARQRPPLPPVPDRQPRRRRGPDRRDLREGVSILATVRSEAGNAAGVALPDRAEHRARPFPCRGPPPSPRGA